MAEAWSWSTAVRTGPSPQELARARAEVLAATAAPVAELWRGMTTRDTLAFRGSLEADVARLRVSDEPQKPAVRESTGRTGAPLAALNRALNRAARRVEEIVAPVPVFEGPRMVNLVRLEAAGRLERSRERVVRARRRRCSQEDGRRPPGPLTAEGALLDQVGCRASDDAEGP